MNKKAVRIGLVRMYRLTLVSDWAHPGVDPKAELNKTEIHVNWIKAHVGNQGNEVTLHTTH